MTFRRIVSRAILLTALCSVPVWAQAPAAPQTPDKPYVPQSGQAGKDVVWVPTSDTLVAKMLDMAAVTPKDFVVDLGSGDGRTVIAAAKRGATALGIEYNPDMVALSQRNAQAAGVASKATFVKADLFETDFSKATVVTLFLLPQINLKLRPKILDMAPGTRIVANTFTMDDWQPDETATVSDNCTNWCTALFWIVPAKVAGTWQTPNGDLVLTQQFQVVSGTLASKVIAAGKLRGNDITFTVDSRTYTGTVAGNSMQGTISGGGKWTATRR